MCDVMYYYFLAESMVWYAKGTKDKVGGGEGGGLGFATPVLMLEHHMHTP